MQNLNEQILQQLASSGNAKAQLLLSKSKTIASIGTSDSIAADVNELESPSKASLVAYSDLCHLDVHTKEFAKLLATEYSQDNPLFSPSVSFISDESSSQELDIGTESSPRKAKTITILSPRTNTTFVKRHKEYGEACKEPFCKKIFHFINKMKLRLQSDEPSYLKDMQDLSDVITHNQSIISSMSEEDRAFMAEATETALHLEKITESLESEKQLSVQFDIDRQNYLLEIEELKLETKELLAEGAALSRALYIEYWGNDSKRFEYQRIAEELSIMQQDINRSLRIKVSSHDKIEKSMSCKTTTYPQLVRDDLLDLGERSKLLKPLPSLHLEKAVESILSPHSPLQRHSSSISSIQSPTDPLNQYLRSLSLSKSTLKSRKSLSLKSPKKLSPLSLEKSNFITSQSNSKKLESSTRYISTNFNSITSTTTSPTNHPNQSTSFKSTSSFNKSVFSSVDEAMQSAQVEVLDPVFYRNDARMQMFRDSPVGKIRQQQKTKEVNSECLYPPLPNEFSGSNQTSNGILLTSKHPGQDMMNMSISMMTTSEADFN